MSEDESDIQIGLSDQGVTVVRCISIRRDGKLIATKHLILTFNKLTLPSFITAGYLRCPVCPYVPNPLRCFKCQQFGHSQTACRGKSICAQCGTEDHVSTECKSIPCCVNCRDAHSFYPWKCPAWQREKEVQRLKTINNISYTEARRMVTPSPPTKQKTFAAVLKFTKTSGVQTDISVSPSESLTRHAKCLLISSAQSEEKENTKTKTSVTKMGVTTRNVGSKKARFNLYRHNRANGGVAILVSNHIPSLPIQITTDLQAVAVKISIGVTVTVCSIYLPPDVRANEDDLDALVEQLPTPFLLLGDFNGHNPMWGSSDINRRGRTIERFIGNQQIYLFNTGEVTYFHAPTRTFTAIYLSLASPNLFSAFSWEVGSNPLSSDHFPIFLKYRGRESCETACPPRWKLETADWPAFSSLANIIEEMVNTADINDAVKVVTSSIIQAAEKTMGKTSTRYPKHPKPWWNQNCEAAFKAQKKAWRIFRRYPTAKNFIAFKKAKANARGIRRQSQRDSWRKCVSSITSSTSSKAVWDKIH
ncbi:uncharacterized protein LOC111612975 [Centruroides sculpturatus]|uniref:uncharacterized protein LOC111612975 n=1 Tax=Centruroides sculpturatus TaxID=218467 RepID=UPI000C6ED3DC|nr:uncharacterized protein LOC111612975 [Centruroides sculpturatus]